MRMESIMDTAETIRRCVAAGTHEPNYYGVCMACNRLYYEWQERRERALAGAITRAHPDGVVLTIEVIGYDDDRAAPVGITGRRYATCGEAVRATRDWSDRHEDAEYRAYLAATDGTDIDWPEA